MVLISLTHCQYSTGASPPLPLEDKAFVFHFLGKWVCLRRSTTAGDLLGTITSERRAVFASKYMQKYIQILLNK